jgi:hypothetical protein
VSHQLMLFPCGRKIIEGAKAKWATCHAAAAATRLNDEVHAQLSRACSDVQLTFAAPHTEVDQRCAIFVELLGKAELHLKPSANESIDELRASVIDTARSVFIVIIKDTPCFKFRSTAHTRCKIGTWMAQYLSVPPVCMAMSRSTGTTDKVVCIVFVLRDFTVKSRSTGHPCTVRMRLHDQNSFHCAS